MNQVRRMLFAQAALVTVLAASVPAIAFQDEGTVRIGLMETQTGTYAPFGLANLWGSLIAIDEINAAGGVMVDGKKVKIAVAGDPNGYDLGNDPAQSISLLKRMVADDKVLMVKGLSYSNAGVTVFNYLNELDKDNSAVVVQSSSLGTPGITQISKWAFRNSFVEVDTVGTLAASVQKKTGAKKAALFINKDNPYFPSIAEKAIIPALKSLGIEVTATAYSLTSDRDLSRQVDEIRATEPDIVYVLAATLPSINFLKEAKRRGLAPKLYLGGTAQITAEFLKSGGDAVEGMVLAGSYDPQSPLIAKFADDYKKRFSQDIGLFSVCGDESIYLVKDAIEKSGIKNTPATLQEDRQKFRDALAKASITSITGEKVAFNENRETPKGGVVLVVKNGQFVVWN